MKPTAFRPLSDVTVLVTRPEGQGANLAGLIEADGGRAVLAPLLNIEPGPDPARPSELLNDPESWDWLIFVSANAVRQALGLEGWTRRLTGRTRIAAVGETTAAELERAGLRVDLVPYSSASS